jgi:hypothetical protein
MEKLFSRPRLLGHREAITYEAGAGEKTGETASPQILDNCPGREPKAELGIRNEECRMKIHDVAD